MTFAVKIYWNTDADGHWVDVRSLDDQPFSIYGPFDSITDAVSWMENDYPDDDTDVYSMVADDFDIPAHWVISDPRMFQDGLNTDPEHPDEDIRPESQELHGP